MVKTRFSSTDVKAMAKDVLRAMEGRRVANVYDINDRCYILKLAASKDSEKSFLLLESGVRFHGTAFFNRSQSQSPSPFTMILRRFLRTKRLERVDQLGMDRVVDFKFGSGESANHLILELYSTGNIVLTDANYEVLALLRSHQFSEELVLKVGEIYPISCCTNIDSLQSSSEELTRLSGGEAFSEWLALKTQHFMEEQSAHDAIVETKTKKKKGQSGAGKLPFVRQLLLTKKSCVSYLGPDILDHCLAVANIDHAARVEGAFLSNHEQLSVLLEQLRLAVGTLLTQLDVPAPAYLLVDPSPVEGGEECFVDFIPILFKQHDGKAYRTFPSFSEAVDVYFHRLDDQKAQKEVQSRIIAAEKKLAKVKEDQKKAVDALVEQQIYFQNCAMLLETFAEEVDKVRLVINSALAAEMAWPDVEAMVDMEQKKGNPLAQRISRLALQDNKIFLRFYSRELGEDFEDSDEEDNTALDEKQRKERDCVEVEVDLDLTAYANACKLYDNKKATQVKEAKRSQASVKILKAAEEQTRKVVTNALTGAPTPLAVRKPNWFEKFYWFLTSEGFLVVAGRDLMQSEVIYRKYLRPQDVFVHADVRGALPCIVFARQCNQVDEEGSAGGESSQAKSKHHLTPLAIQEAAIAVLCRSSAWQAKLLISAYWVTAAQVSKVDPHGQSLPTGNFFISGKKNFLPPMPLEMGFGIIFRLDNESALRHSKDRKLREYDFDLESLTSQVMDRFEKYNITVDLEQQVTQDEDIVEEGGEEEEEEAGRLDELLPPESADPEVLATKEEGEHDAAEKEEERNEQEEEQQSDDDEEDGDIAPVEASSKPSSKPNESGKKDAPLPEKSQKKKKAMNKKKARRYAEQDDEDVELAMMVLGHASKKSGKTLASLKEEENVNKKQSEIRAKQGRAGVTSLKGDWQQLVSLLSPEVQDLFQTLIKNGVIQDGGIDADVLRDLSLFPVPLALRALADFRDYKNLSKTKNKSSLLLGIMKTVRKDMEKGKAKAIPSIKSSVSKEAGQNLTEHVDELDEDEEGDSKEEKVDLVELDFFTDCPTSLDKLIYALPVCAPYMSMQRFKLKVKLSPGTLKKGKVAKQAMDLLPRLKDCIEPERALIKTIPDNEVLGVLIGDVRLSAPGLHQQIKQKKQRGQK